MIDKPFKPSITPLRKVKEGEPTGAVDLMTHATEQVQSPAGTTEVLTPPDPIIQNAPIDYINEIVKGTTESLINFFPAQGINSLMFGKDNKSLYKFRPTIKRK